MSASDIKDINRYIDATSRWRIVSIVLIVALAVLGVAVTWLDIAGIVDMSDHGVYDTVNASMYGIFGISCVSVGIMLWYYNKAYPKYVRYRAANMGINLNK